MKALKNLGLKLSFLKKSSNILRLCKRLCKSFFKRQFLSLKVHNQCMQIKWHVEIVEIIERFNNAWFSKKQLKKTTTKKTMQIPKLKTVLNRKLGKQNVPLRKLVKGKYSLFSIIKTKRQTILWSYYYYFTFCNG